MAETIRKTRGPSELNALWAHVACLELLVGFSTFDAPTIGDGTTAGNLRTNATAGYRIAGAAYSKASTDDLWDLSGETDTTAAQYRAYWLYLDDAGAATFGAGANAASAAAALAALPTPPETKGILGVFVADPSCDFDDAGGLEAQGTVYDGLPAGVPIGVPGKTYAKPQGISLVTA